MKINSIPACRYTGATDVEVLYDGPIRSGGAGSTCETGYRVISCRSSGLVWLDPFPANLESYYMGDSYWSEHHDGKVDIELLRRKLYHEQLRWLEEVRPESLRGKVVADFGCGSGIFFDLIGGVAARRVGIDLAAYFKPLLESNGHEFLHFKSDLGKDWLDAAVCFDTLEHTPEPWNFLKTVHQSLKPGGTLFLGVPSNDDFLKQLVPDYLPFFFHRSHLWYFTGTSLKMLFDKAGFRVDEIRHVHKYDLMNMIVWARESKGVGKKGGNIFDRHTEESFRRNIERQGLSSHVMICATKP